MAHGDITHFEIPVGDFSQSTDFYNKLFGWEIATIPGFEGYPMWQAPNKQSGGGLVERTDEFTQPRAYVTVDSIEESLAVAEANGGKLVAGRSPIDETSWWAAVEDLDGNVVGLFEGETGA